MWCAAGLRLDLPDASVYGCPCSCPTDPNFSSADLFGPVIAPRLNRIGESELFGPRGQVYTKGPAMRSLLTACFFLMLSLAPASAEWKKVGFVSMEIFADLALGREFPPL